MKRIRSWLLPIVLAVAAGPLAAQQLAPPLREYPFVIRYWPGGERLAQRVLELARADEALPGIPAGLWLNDTIEIVLAPSEALLQEATGGQLPEWGAGAAVPSRGLVVLPAWASVQRGGPLDFVVVLRHELAHVALHRATAPARVPRWFTEGYASWAAGQLDWDSAWMLRIAFVTGRAPPLDSLELGWPRNAAPARLAYLLSASVIEYLVEESGEYGLQRLFERSRESGDFNQALVQTYGTDVIGLESAWRRHVKRRYGWTVVVTQSALFGAMIGVVALALFLVRRRRDRKKLAALRASETAEAPPYWSEGGIEIIAHRGYSAQAPENTLVAFERALEAGAGSVELDIHVTADGVPVVLHDETLERTTTGRGHVARFTREELLPLDAGSWFAPEFAGEPLPTLEDVLRALRGRVNRIYIELKPQAFGPAQLDALLWLLERYDFNERVVLMSFDWSAVEYLALRSLDATVAFLADDPDSFLRALEHARADGRALVDCNYRILLAHPELARHAAESGVELAVYTVNDAATAARLVDLGVKRITTNEVGLLLHWARGRE